MKILKVYKLLLIVALSFIASICLYSRLPDSMATHWSGSAEPDGYMPKLAGAFVIPVILAVVVGVQALIFYCVFSAGVNKQFRMCINIHFLVFAVFLFFVHMLVLLFNLGVNVNVPLYVIIGAGILIVASIVPMVSFMRRDKSSVEIAPIDISAADSQEVYSDKLVEITADSIVFNKYYFPFGNKKTVEFSKIEYVKVLKGDNLRLWGSDDFRTWFPADFGRMDRDCSFIVHLRNKWSRIGFTVEDSAAVMAILKNKGLLGSDV